MATTLHICYAGPPVDANSSTSTPTHLSVRQQQPVQHHAADAASGASSHTTATAAAAPSTATAQPASAPPLVAGPQKFGVDRDVQVYSRHAFDEAAASAPSISRGEEVPDDFFELTPDDYAAMMRAKDARHKEESMFKTRAQREADEHARAASYGPVIVRLHLPDGTQLHMSFKATEPLSNMQELVAKLVVPELTRAFYLYTTPPKQVLKDLSLTFYKAQLVPAAHVYLHVDDKKVPNFTGPYLQPDVQAAAQDHMAPTAQPEADGAAAAAKSTPSAAAAAAAATVAAEGATASVAAAAGPKYTASGQKVPKWMKLGGK